MRPFTRRCQQPHPDRRLADDRVRYDAPSGTLVVGWRTAIVRLDDNDAVLRAYLTLVIAQRDMPAGSPVGLRDDDITALAQLLDLEDSHLERRLISFLGISAGDAANLRARLRHRALRSAAAMGVGVLAALPLTAGPAHAAPTGPAVAGPTATGSNAVAAKPVRKLTTAPTAAPATVRAPEPVAAIEVPAPAPEPAPEIGDAIRVERGEDGSILTYTESADDPDPDDGADIGTALTVERTFED